MRGAAAIAVLLMAQASVPVMAKPGTPGPAWFTGVFERVGRDASGGLLDDQVSVRPYGDGLEIVACGGQDSILSFGPAFEIVNLLSGSRGQAAMECLFHNNGYMRPILTCRADDGAAFTLWPKGKTEDWRCTQ